ELYTSKPHKVEIIRTLVAEDSFYIAIPKYNLIKFHNNTHYKESSAKYDAGFFRDQEDQQPNEIFYVIRSGQIILLQQLVDFNVDVDDRIKFTLENEKFYKGE